MKTMKKSILTLIVIVMMIGNGMGQTQIDCHPTYAKTVYGQILSVEILHTTLSTVFNISDTLHYNNYSDSTNKKLSAIINIGTVPTPTKPLIDTVVIKTDKSSEVIGLWVDFNKNGKLEHGELVNAIQFGHPVK